MFYAPWFTCQLFHTCPSCLSETICFSNRFHLVPYSVRVWTSTLLLVLSLVTVGYGGSTSVQLLGVCFSSLQGGLGEASFLALASFYDTPRALTAWSSGTGFAGIFGYAWVFSLKFTLGFSFRTTLMAANLLGLVFLYAYFVLLSAPHSGIRSTSSEQQARGGNGAGGAGAADSPIPSSRPSPSLNANSGSGRAPLHTSTGGDGVREGEEEEEEEEWSGGGEGWRDVEVTTVESCDPPEMTVGERLRFTLSLWRFTIPLMLVYFAEVRALPRMDGPAVFAMHNIGGCASRLPLCFELCKNTSHG